MHHFFFLDQLLGYLEPQCLFNGLDHVVFSDKIVVVFMKLVVNDNVFP